MGAGTNRALEHEDQTQENKQGKPEDKLPGKTVTARAMQRLGVAREAIAVTKKVLSFGAGNQIEALKATKMNSKFRMDAMREPSYWEIAPEVVKIARENPEALVAAKAELVHGGNCGEHGWIAFDYIREHCKGDFIERVTSDIDHGFALIGDRSKEPHAEVAVADPWPTRATACLWEDHFCYTTGITTRKAMEADGQSLKGAVGAGLKLSAEGKAAAERAATAKETEDAVSDPAGNHFWDQADSAQVGKKYNYTTDATK
jgi:hypothetical protein